MKYIIGIAIIIFSFKLSAQINQVDSKGRKQGEWAKAYPNSKVLQYHGQFKDDKPVGTFTYYYQNKKVKAVIKHESGSNRSVAYMYHDNGELMSHGIYRDMKKDSVWMNFGPSGRLSTKETYLKDSLHGTKTIYFVPEDPQDKRRIVSAIYNYNNGVIDGAFTEYFDVGSVRRTGAYLNGQKHGEWMSYEPTGQKLNLTRYKNGARHGWCIAYEHGKEVNRMYYYMGDHYEGERLQKLFRQMKAKGVNPND